MTTATAAAVTPIADAPKAKRGMFALIERRHSYMSLKDGHHAWSTYTPCIVSSVSRDGVVKAVKLAGQDWPLQARDWQQITIDSANRIAEPEAVAAALVDADGRAIEYMDQGEAVAAIKGAAGINDEMPTRETVGKRPQKPESAGNANKAKRGHLRVVEAAPLQQNRTVPPRRAANRELREREHLTEREIELLYDAAKRHGRYGARDALMVWMGYRHGMRVGELVRLRWQAHIDFGNSTIRVERLKRGVDSVHPLGEREIRGLRRLQKENGDGRYVFVNERGAPISDEGFRKTLARIAATVPELAGLKLHPHMLRHSCGFALANKGMDTRSLQHYLGHRRIEHTELYTAMSATRFDRVWD